MGGAVFERALQLQHHLARAVTLEPFVGDRRAGDIAAQVLQFLALDRRPSAPLHGGESSKVWRIGPAWMIVWARHALQAQHLLPRSWPERDAVGAGGRLQGQKRAFPIRFGEVGPVLLFDEKTLLGKPPHDACDDLCK